MKGIMREDLLYEYLQLCANLQFSTKFMSGWVAIEKPPNGLLEIETKNTDIFSDIPAPIADKKETLRLKRRIAMVAAAAANHQNPSRLIGRVLKLS
nr:MAG TPA: hypothetical protein [Caudoviricetes sp.]